jgi:Calx-beta domain-containing protein
LIAACAACSFHAPTDVDAVVDNPPVVTFEFAMSVTDEGVQTANVRLHMNRAAVDPVTVDVDITGGTAMRDIDYTLANASATFAPGDTTALLPVGIVQDVAEEDDETIDLAIVAVHGGDIGDQSTHVLTISKNLLPRVAFAAPASSANEPDGAQTFGLTLTVASPVDIVVSYTVGGTASAADQSLADSTITIPAGQTSVDLTDAITNDQIDENDETVDLTIVNATNAVIGPVAEHVHTIVDEDPPPTIGFTVASQTVNENVGTVNVVVQLSLESGKQISVDLASSGNAVAGADFTLSATSLTFAPGETSKTVTLAVVDDGLDEDDEVATLALSNLQNVSAGQTTRTLTITDNDAPPQIDFAQASTSVDEGVGSTTIEVDLSAPSGKDVTFSLTSSGAAAVGTDFTLPTQPITIPAGQSSINVAVTITNDPNDEDDESAQLAFTGLGNATPGNQTTHTLTILDNDNPPQVRFDPNVGDQSAAEGDTGTTSFTYKVVLNVASGKTVSVGITRTGTASTPGDFTFGTGDIPVVFAPGDTTKDVHVIVKGDRSNEPNETVIMTLQTPSNGTNANNNQVRTHTIQDDD